MHDIKIKDPVIWHKLVDLKIDNELSSMEEVVKFLINNLKCPQ